MIGLHLHGAARLRDDLPEPQRGPGEALLAVRAAGICDTDLQLARGYLGYEGVLGHELVGVVTAADDVRLLGQRVVADINAGCGACADCVSRDGHHCARRTVLGIVGRDGALAERCVVPERCLVPVPDSVPDDAAVFAEPLAAALHVASDVPDLTRPVAVLGDGKLGLLVALALAQAGAPVTLVGHHREKLALAARAGVTTLLESELADLRFPAVVEATGTDTGLTRALSLAEPRGRIILKTTVAGRTTADLSPIVIHELSVVGSRCGDLRAAIACLASGALDPRPLIAARYPLARAEEALAHAARRGTLKVLVDVSG